MSKSKIRNFSVDVKTKIVLEMIREESTVAELSSKYEVSAKTLHSWRKQFLANASIAFEPAKAISEYKEQIDSLKAQNDELAKALGKTTVQRDWAVGKLKSLDFLNKKTLVGSKLKLSKTRQYEMLGINRSTVYYKAESMNPYDKDIMKKIEQIYLENPEYGYRFIHKQLLEDGYCVGRDRVLKYMRKLNIQGICPKKRKGSNNSKSHKTHSYLLGEYWVDNGNTRSIYIPHTNEVWSGDITYIKINGFNMYLASIIDWRAVLSYKLSHSMDASLTTGVLQEAISKYGSPKIFNSDQGSQYTSSEHIKILEENKIMISMNGRGRSIDNIGIERFFRTLKYAGIFLHEIRDIKELKSTIENFMDKYNYRRFHSSIGYKKPMDVYLDGCKKAA